MAYYKRPNNYDSDVPLPQTEAKMSGRPQARPAEEISTPVTVAANPVAAENGYSAYLEKLMAQQAEAKAQRDAAVNKAFNAAKANLEDNKNASLRDSYVAYMKGLKTMPQVNALGGNGGYAQSLATKQQLGYENKRASIQQGYIDALRELEANNAASLASNTDNYLTGVQNLEGTAQNYLAQLNMLQKNNAKTTTTGEYKYKVGNKTMSRSALLEYLANLGYTEEQAEEYFKNNGLTL